MNPVDDDYYHVTAPKGYAIEIFMLTSLGDINAQLFNVKNVALALVNFTQVNGLFDGFVDATFQSGRPITPKTTALLEESYSFCGLNNRSKTSENHSADAQASLAQKIKLFERL